jgi:hypothetical protein
MDKIILKEPFGKEIEEFLELLLLKIVGCPIDCWICCPATEGGGVLVSIKLL